MRPTSLLAPLVLAAGACSPLPATVASAAATHPSGVSHHTEIEIAVTHLAPGSWQVEYSLPRGAQRLRFSRARTTFSRARWEVVTPGLQLVSTDSAEYVQSADGRLFRNVVLRFPSDPIKHEREYILNPAFTDGSEGLYTGLLYVNIETGSATPETARVTRETRTLLHLTPAPGERLLIQGRVSHAPVEWRDERGAGTYAYFGSISPTESARVVAIIDPGLPPHLRAMFDSLLPPLFDHFASAFGYPLEVRPLILIGFTPGDRTNLSSHGDVLPGMIRFGFDGLRWADDDEETRRRAFYLLAHEAVHLWNGERFESAENRESPWMHEGAAEALAFLAMRDFGVLDEESLLHELEDALNECLFVTRGTAWGETMSVPRAPYACGSVMNMIVDAALAERGGLPAFWRALFAAAESTGRRYSSRQYLETLASVAPDDDAVRLLRALLTDASAGEPRDVADALGGLGVQARVDAPPAREQASRQLARRAMTVLMQSDCNGRYSFGVEPGGFRANAIAVCRTLPKEGSTVTGLEGRSITSDPAGAYAAMAERCASGESVSVTIDGRSDPLAIRCSLPLPSYVRLERWPRAGARTRSTPTVRTTLLVPRA